MSRIDQAIGEFRRIDELADAESPVHRISPLPKLAVTVVYILTVMSFPNYDLSGLSAMLIYPVFVSALSNVPLKAALYRLRYILPLVMAVGIFNPFFDRTVMFTLGTLKVSGGVVSMLVLMMKGVFCLLASYLLIACTKADALFGSLRRVRVPAMITTLLMLTFRYITVLGEEAGVMMDAYLLRAPDQKGLHYSAWGSFIGQLLLRTMDRAQELYESMLLRGYNGEFPETDGKKTEGKDILYAAAWIAVILLLRFCNIAELAGRLVTGGL